MRFSFWVLLTVCVIIGVLPVAVSAVPITDADVSIDFIIDGGDSGDSHYSNGWLVAGSGIPSTVQVEYHGAMSPDIHYVRFTSLEEDTYGDVSQSYVSAAPYETVFSASKNVAGNAPIQVQINYTADGIGYDYYKTVYQPIDHNTPIAIQDLAFESEVTLDSTMYITMSMMDAYGNTVTSLYEDATGCLPEDVTFSTTPYAGSGFYNGTGYGADSVTVPVNEEGMVVATFKVGTESGPKYLVHITPNVCVDDIWLTITALANGEPDTMVVSVVPNLDTPPYVSADGESRFYLIYHLFDRYGNPSGNQEVHFSNDVTDVAFTRWTNSDGDIKISFGPFDYATTVTVHAEAVANPFVAVDQKLRFVSTAPEGMYLTASPQSMPSADVGAALDAQILVKVTDEGGNGVSGETVQFTIIPPVLWDEAHASDPYLGDTAGVTDATVMTNEDGFAVVNFTPGAFTCSGEENYSATALESCEIQAIWGTESQKITIKWMNYPYLRVETEVSPETVEVGETVDVSIRLTGDGWGLYPSPIDVMLCADRSGSMLEDNPDRMVSAMDAMQVFNGKMTEGTDRVGLVSFGARGCADIYDYSKSYWAGDDSKANYTYYVKKWFLFFYYYEECYNQSEDIAYIDAHYPGNGNSYTDYATLDHYLTKEIDLVNQAIDQLVPMDSTPMRQGLYLAIKEIVSNGDPDAVKAVILLSDGDYNTGGDPLARIGSSNDFDYYDDLSPEQQNLSVYANDHNIALYTISFGDGLSDWGISTLETLAKSTGGNYSHAPTGDDLAAIYIDIAGELRVEAGVNTTMDLMFTTIERNNVTEVNSPDDRILEYTFVDDLSTLIKSWNTPLSPHWSEQSDNIIRPLTLIDQTDDWVNNQKLSFDTTEIGTLNLGQIWQTKYRLNVSKPGNINIFGEGSQISFNDGDETLALPKTYITAVLNATGTNFTGLEVSDLICVEDTNGDVIGKYLTLQWNLSYGGTEDVTQSLYYKKMGGSWVEFNEITAPVSEPVSLQTGLLYVADFPPGEYKLRVRAVADDASESIVETSDVIEIGQDGKNFIRLG